MERHKSEESTGFQQRLQKTFEEKIFMRFDVFMMQEMGYEFRTLEELALLRRPAFRLFRTVTHQYRFASLPTIRRWFGIAGQAQPSREQVLEICVVLKTGYEKANEYLMQALGETEIELNDYKEFIYGYVLWQSGSIVDCEKMIFHYESVWQDKLNQWIKEPEDIDKQMFYEICAYSKDEVLKWMLNHYQLFKGYRSTHMKQLQQCKKTINDCIRREASERLESLLSETNYANWAQKRKGKSINERELIKRYVNNHADTNYYKTSENMRDNILELSQIVYSEVDANSRLLAEVFTSSNKNNGVLSLSRVNIHNMTAKHLSDLFNIPLQKQRAILATKAYRMLQQFEDDSPCPKVVQKMHNRYMREEKILPNALAARKWVTVFLREQRRRCVNIHRMDILPFVHYIAQYQYLENIEQKREEYSVVKARQEFIDLANESLLACGMEPFNEEYEIDCVLLACFQKDEMYTYSELRDVITKIE